MNNLEEVDPADEARTYRQAPLWRRLSVALAGSAMHFLIAAVVLFVMFFWTGDNGNYLTSSASLPASNPIVEIDGLTTGASPAQQAGFHLGDRIVAVDGRHFANWAQLSSYIQARADQRLDVTVERAGRLVQLFPVPVNRNDVRLAGPGSGALPAARNGAPPVGFIGISPSPVIHSSLGASLSRAGGAWVHVSALTLGAFGHLFTLHGVSSYLHMLGNQKAADNPGPSGVRFESPVGIVRLLHQAGQSGLPSVLWLLAVINLSLGIFNLLPYLPARRWSRGGGPVRGRAQLPPAVPRRRGQAPAAVLRRPGPGPVPRGQRPVPRPAGPGHLATPVPTGRLDSSGSISIPPPEDPSAHGRIGAGRRRRARSRCSP